MHLLQSHNTFNSLKCFNKYHKPLKTINVNVHVLETHSIKSIIDYMFEILTHPDLSHEFILVSVHTSQLTNMREYVV